VNGRMLAFAALVMLAISLAPTALAFEPENQPDPPPPAGCLGSNDPYCEGGGGGGGGGGWSPGCKECFTFPDGPDGQPGGPECIVASSGGYAVCTVDAYGCRTSSRCILV